MDAIAKQFQNSLFCWVTFRLIDCFTLDFECLSKERSNADLECSMSSGCNRLLNSTKKLMDMIPNREIEFCNLTRSINFQESKLLIQTWSTQKLNNISTERKRVWAMREGIPRKLAPMANGLLQCKSPEAPVAHHKSKQNAAGPIPDENIVFLGLVGAPTTFVALTDFDEGIPVPSFVCRRMNESRDRDKTSHNSLDKGRGNSIAPPAALERIGTEWLSWCWHHTPFCILAAMKFYSNTKKCVLYSSFGFVCYVLRSATDLLGFIPILRLLYRGCYSSSSDFVAQMLQKHRWCNRGRNPARKQN